MSRLFENHRTDWGIRVTKDEVVRVGFAVSAMSRRASDKPVVWLTKSSPTRRLWILRDRATLAWISADASPTDPRFALALPDHFIEEMMHLTADNDSVELFCDESEDVIVCKADGRFIAIDHPRDLEFTPFDLPYIGNTHGEPGHHAVAVASGMDLLAFANTCTNVPTRAEINFYPFVKVAIGEGTFRWTMDWRRHGLWRVSRSFPASTEGEATFTFYPWSACHVMSTQDPHGDVKVFVDGPDADFVYFVGDDWGVRIINDAEHLGHWDTQVRFALDKAGCTVDAPAGDRIPAVIDFVTPQGHTAIASIHAHDDGCTETLRLMRVVASGVTGTEPVLREINALNDSLLGARLVLRDGEVRVTVDLSPEALDNFESRLADFTRAVEICEGLDVFLPLFGD